MRAWLQVQRTYTKANGYEADCTPHPACLPACVRAWLQVQRTYTKANGYEADCEVIYGDTDSVMVNFKVCAD